MTVSGLCASLVNKPRILDIKRVTVYLGYPPLPSGNTGYSCGAHKLRLLTFIRLVILIILNLGTTAVSRQYWYCWTHLEALNWADIFARFLYADPTPSALQVFHRGIKADSSGQKIGQWINADPIPDCIVCNIGESMGFVLLIWWANSPLVWEIWTAGLYKRYGQDLKSISLFSMTISKHSSSSRTSRIELPVRNLTSSSVPSILTTHNAEYR